MTRQRTPSALFAPWLVLVVGLAAGCSYDFTVLDPDGGTDPDATVDAGDASHLDAAVDGALDGGVDASPDADVPCGNGILDTGEDCDGTNLGGANCVSEGWQSGHLVCLECAFDDNLCRNACGGRASGYCPASSISDDFDDGISAALWGDSFVSGSAAMLEAGGVLTLTPGTTGAGYAAYMTDDLYDLRTYSITVELVQPINNVSSTECSLEITDTAHSDFAGFSLSGGDLTLFSFVGGTNNVVASVVFNHNFHRYWRLWALGGYIFADTSSDGLNWTTLGGAGAPFPMDAVHLALKAGTWAMVASPGEAQFDNFNILPD